MAARSGVAKTTIYRRYRDREDLLRVCLERVTDQEIPPADLSAHDKLRWTLRRAGTGETLAQGDLGALVIRAHGRAPGQHGHEKHALHA